MNFIVSPIGDLSYMSMVFMEGVFELEELQLMVERNVKLSYENNWPDKLGNEVEEFNQL